MQSYAPLAASQLLEPVQNMLFKLEVWDGAAWRNLANLGGRSYLKGIQVSLGGARQSTTPVAGTWSAIIDNRAGIFHPKHPTSTWAGLLRTGREIKISVGGTYGGVAYYWQRLAGFMEAPSFDHGAHEVHIGGQDYMQLLTSTILGEQDPIAESGSGSGSGGVDDIINGPTHWGGRATFDSKATGGAGSELYDEADACEIGAGEADNVNNWSCPIGGAVSSEGPAPESNYLLRLTRDADWLMSGDNEYCENTNVASLTVGQRYIMSFWGRTVYNASDSGGYGRLQVRQGSTSLGQVNFSGDGGYYQLIFTAASTAAMILRLYGSGKYARGGDYFEIDEVSIKTYDPDTWWQYDLPVECTGPYFLTLDGEPIGMGYQDDQTSWHYDQQANSVHFGEQAVIENGADNLKVYYYTTQTLENVLADLLVYCGLYASRAAALADMDYTPTGISLDRVWFDPNTTALAAVAKICERANYRFWFSFDGKPCFQPAPVADSIIWTFPAWGDLQGLGENQDDDMIRNAVTVEGCQRNLYQLSRDDKASDKFKGYDEDAASIAAYNRKPHGIQNHLFQTDLSCAGMASTIVAADKDPKLYGDLTVFANPVPLEIGDVVEFQVELEPPTTDGGTSGDVTVTTIGIIRDIKISDHQVLYKVEEVDELWSPGSVSPSASPSASASVPPSASETPSASASPESPITYTLDATDDGMDIVIPAGYTQAVIECWGGGGTGYGFFAPGLHGGGAGGGGKSIKTLAVSAGQTLHCDIPTGNAKDCYVTRSAIVVCRAESGSDGQEVAGGQGGQTASAVGDTKYSGGNGYYTAGGFVGGGGGSSAGNAANGNNATGQNGAVAPAGGGNGGNGGARYGDGNPGSDPGGGGGGCGDDGLDDRVGGAGGDGKIVITLT